MFKRWLIAFLLCFAGVAAAADFPVVGAPAPAFTLTDQDSHEFRLDSQIGKWVVLYFYPKDDTPACTKEACSFRDDYAKLSALGAQVVGVSVDDNSSHAAFARKHHLPFPLLADRGGVVAKRYGAFSDWLVVSYARRHTFLIDPQGKIAKVYLNVDAENHAAEVIADLKRLAGKP
jgi:peroxiredoxin Q/BCP